jgi:hypothetical protein
VTSSVSDPTTKYADVIRECDARWGIMGNAQVHAAVGAQVAPQFITIPPPLFRSFQGEVAAHLLPATLHGRSQAPRAPQALLVRVMGSRRPGGPSRIERTSEWRVRVPSRSPCSAKRTLVHCYPRTISGQAQSAAVAAIQYTETVEECFVGWSRPFQGPRRRISSVLYSPMRSRPALCHRTGQTGEPTRTGIILD